MSEIWKDIGDGYEVSSLGRVKGPRKISYGSIGSRGYLQVCIKRKTKNVHVLVAEAFLGDRPEGHHVCHTDGNKRNNSLSNLRYGTPQENWEDFRNNPQNTTHAIARKTCPLGHDLIGDNLMISQMKRGWRSCLACSRAAAYLKNGKYKDLYNQVDLANKYYEEIINGNN